MNRGLTKSSEVREELVKRDKDTCVRFRVVEEIIDLRELRRELVVLENPTPEPTQEELIEIGKSLHPFYTQGDVSGRIEEIKSILGQK